MNRLFELLGVAARGEFSLNNVARRLDIPAERLKYYNDTGTVPSGIDLEKLQSCGFSEALIRIVQGHLSPELIDRIRSSPEIINSLNVGTSDQPHSLPNKKADFSTSLGQVFQADCIDFLRSVESDSVDLVFADPPFNLNKTYPSQVDDLLRSEDYLSWCKAWLFECCRVLRHGGSLFLWNLPKWNLSLAEYLNGMLTFRNNIAVDIKYSLPIQGRLYPSNYSLLYYVKGARPNHFDPDRLPMPTCPHCYGDLKDYGGYKSKMNPKGVNIADVWTDISPVRHRKYKKREGVNELPLRLMDRIIQMGSAEGDLVLDPFGGAGTTYVTAELKNRRWIGCEVGPLDHITDRFKDIESDRQHLHQIRSSLNSLFEHEVKTRREKHNLWTCESVRRDAPVLFEEDLFSST